MAEAIENYDSRLVTEDSTQSDEDIIRKVLGGELELFRVLVRRHQNLVFSSVMKQVGSRDIAEECAQETFIKAYKNLGRFRFEARFSTWLLRIAINTSASYFASRVYKERMRATAFDVREHDIADSSSEDEQLEQRRQLNCFREAISLLPLRLREVLILCGIEGRTYEEAASLLGVPVGTVRSRLNKARLTVRELVFKQSGVEEL